MINVWEEGEIIALYLAFYWSISVKLYHFSINEQNHKHSKEDINERNNKRKH